VLQAAAVLWTIQVVQAQGTALSGWELAGPLALGGVGLGLLVVPLVDTALATVDAADAGAASGVYGTFQQVGAAIGVAVIGVVFFGVVDTTFTAARLEEAIVAAGWVAVAGFTVCALATTLLPGRAAVRAHAEREQALLG
jgi:MFS family permease